MRTITAFLTVAMLLFACGYALATQPADGGYERANRTPGSAISPFSGNTTLQGLSVLLALADGDTAGDEVRDSLLASGIADVVDHFSCRTGTPTMADLEGYDCVITWSNNTYYNPVATGDTLAAYVEAGGAVLICEFAFYAPTFDLEGRIMSEYSPFTTSNTGYQTHNLGWYDPTHPIMDNVTTCSEYFDFAVSLQGNVEDVAHYDNDWPLVAVNADYTNVGAINAHYGANRRWTGDMMRILLNAVVYITGGGPEATMRCETLSPQFCRGKNFYFTLTVKNNTEDNISGTLTFCGYAGYDCDPANVLIGIPRAKTYVPGTTEEYYFFKVPNAVGAGQYSASVGGTLGGIDLFCCMNTDVIQCSPFKAGENTEWSLEQVDRPEAALPTTTALHQNYPNPFNAETNISFSLAEAGNVSLEVYDITGRLVTTLVDGQMEAGEHVVSWDASSVSSGVYFLRLATADFSATKTMNLLK